MQPTKEHPLKSVFFFGLGTWFRATERLARAFQGWNPSIQKNIPSTLTFYFLIVFCLLLLVVVSYVGPSPSQCTLIFTKCSALTNALILWYHDKATPQLILWLLCKTIRVLMMRFNWEWSNSRYRSDYFLVWADIVYWTVLRQLQEVAMRLIYEEVDHKRLKPEYY